MLAWCVYCRRPFESKKKRGRHFCPEEVSALDQQDREDEMTADNLPTVRYAEDSTGPTTLALALARAGLTRR